MDSEEEGKFKDAAGSGTCAKVPESRAEENPPGVKEEANVSCVSGIRESSEIENRRPSSSIDDDDEGKRVKRRKDKDEHGMKKDDHILKSTYSNSVSVLLSIFPFSGSRFTRHLFL